MYYLYYTLTAGNYHCCIECRWHAWVCGGGGGHVASRVGVPGWDSCVRVSVACLDVLCAVMFRLGTSCSLPVVFARCASPCQWVRVHGRWAEPFFVMFIVNIIMLYSLQYRYYQVCEIIFLSYFIYYILYQIDNLRVIDSYLLDWIYISPALNYFH